MSSKRVYEGISGGSRADLDSGEMTIYLKQCKTPEALGDLRGKHVRVTVELLPTREDVIRQTDEVLVKEHCYIGPAGATRTAEEMEAKYRELRALYEKGDREAAAQLDLFDWLDHDLWALYGIDEPAGGEQ